MLHWVASITLSWKAGVDVLTLGTTKSGSFGVETIVTFASRYRTPLALLRKRSGHFAPKSRFLAAQLRAFMEDDLWLKNAKSANAKARRLSEGLQRVPGASLVHPTEGNEVFVQLPGAATDALVQRGCRFQRDWRRDPLHHRFVCSWATTDRQVDEVVAIALAAERPEG